MDDVMKCVSCGEEMVFDHFTNSYVCTLCGRSEMRKSEKTSEELSISMNKEESCRTVLPAEVQKKIDEYQKMPEEFMLSRIGGSLMLTGPKSARTIRSFPALMRRSELETIQKKSPWVS